MAKSYIQIEGIFDTEVLGSFSIIRGFASLQDLAAISVAVFMETPDAAAFPIPGGGGGMIPSFSQCSVPSERMDFVTSVPGVAPRAGMRVPRWGDGLSQRDRAYQPRASLWVSNSPDSRVLKERRISPIGGRVPNPPFCGVPSERMNYIPHIPGVAPRAGMRCSVGALNSAD